MRASREKRKEKISDFIIKNVGAHPRGIAAVTANKFGITRQGVHRYLRQLVAKEVLEKKGKTKDVSYSLLTKEHIFSFKVDPDLDEFRVWIDSIKPQLPALKGNVLDICEYGVTEMVNNVIDHSGSSKMALLVRHNALTVEFDVRDYGVGIFNKIMDDLGLKRKNDALIELTKGKFTSDPDNHSGEGIFFTSRMFDDFAIISDDLCFLGHKDNDWLFKDENQHKGTFIHMGINRNSTLIDRKIFDEYADPETDDYGFSKTNFPMKLLAHEGGKLVSRSQAKRLVARFGLFKRIVLDFKGVPSMGQAFADQVFRVFQAQHPGITITTINTSQDIERMIQHVVKP